MPLTRLVADALGVVTICLVSVLALIGFLCIFYLLYLKNRIRKQQLFQLDYFTGPSITRISFVILACWWGFGEILRLNFLRGEGKLLNALDLQWQENICKYYIISNLGFAEPCLYLTLVFLLRASLQKTERGTLCRKWNRKTPGYIFISCLPLFLLQLIVLLISPFFSEGGILVYKLPDYFTRTAHVSKDSALCTYPLLSIALFGLFVILLTTYLLYLGNRALKLVINKGLQRRVCTLIISFSGFFPLRALFLGLSVLSLPEHYMFEILSFLAFILVLCCTIVGFIILVFFPVFDSLALSNLEEVEDIDTSSLITNGIPVVELNTEASPVAEVTRGSISFRTMEKDEDSSGAFVELSLFSRNQHLTSPGLPQLQWPQLSVAQC